MYWNCGMKKYMYRRLSKWRTWELWKDFKHFPVFFFFDPFVEWIFRLYSGHVAAARKRSHQWCVSLTQTILKQLKEWHFFVSCDQLRETLNHKEIVKRLCYLGTSSQELKSFESYLTVRMQLTRVGTSLSDQLTVNYGVPQGSILRPAILSLHMNDQDCQPFLGNWSDAWNT